ncbi:ComEC/Rec2 family competence protein, partial [Lysinibacillus fusiformis]|uniref:ComEC/Rec2 family competence protein n=1 Tax=Lysinibacillus fusiformis TaxID=28031 RepID=UPI003B979954
DNNEASIVLKMTYGNVSFLLTGDAGVALEKEMLQYDVTVTVLKAGHHGSNTSSPQEFIRAVKPEVTILSYG